MKMLCSLFLLLGFVSSLSYTPGETFSYKYTTNFVNSAVKDEEQEGQKITVSCDAMFTVQQITSKGAYIMLSVKNVESEITDGTDTEKGQNDEEVDELYSLPLYFTQLNDGSIEGVAAHENETDEVLETKVGILYSLRSTILEEPSSGFVEVSVVDTQGIHKEYVEAVSSDEGFKFLSHYTEDDFDHFMDENLSKDNISIEVSNQRVVLNDRIVSSSSQTTMVLNKPNSDTEVNPEYEDGDVSYVVVGDATLSGFAQFYDMYDTELVSCTNAEEHVKLDSNYRLVSFYDRSTMENRMVIADDESVSPVSKATCPSEVNVCKAFNKGVSIGNNNIGFSMGVSFVTGVSKGCSASSRSYLIGVYTSMNFKILHQNLAAAYGEIEYGLVGGRVMNNRILLRIFGKSVYSRTLPYQDCVSRSFLLASASHSFGFSYSIGVYILTVKFTVGSSAALSASLSYSVCPNNLNADIQLIPKVSGSIYAQAKASVVVARAGISLSGSIGDELNPKAYVDGNTCRIGFVVTNTVAPVQGAFIGWWQVRKVKLWKIKWGHKNTKTFWKHNWGGSTQKLVDVYYGAN